MGLRDSHMGRVWVPGPARGSKRLGAALVGLGKQAQLMNPSELTPTAQPPQFLGKPASSTEATLC